ncbi:carboxypeptidase-like regulatory domain-containing protein [Aquirufa antheringensis]|uniref:carboxypeptidase-like regulatory domain-containing protein n=1 Tax=Aquirufa antheringensis TaxID=2516559 RepID=UPI001032E000|nr:carboxypeptidase-like regulatory domain-containing protein [Aquirufa antheringensis]TBH72676.1 carboxypeptidase-like regulatory domain-containing protein [Aquirufa antheringensis]
MKTMAKYLHLFVFVILSFVSFGQQKFSLKGQVLDNKNHSAFPFVNVFIEGTTIGTQTNQDGTFIIKNIPLGSYRLVASMIGYKSAIQNIEILDKSLEIQISLEEDSKVLNEVKVTGSRDKVWEKQIKQFESEFLGNDFNKKEVKILNKEVIDIDYNRETREFSAQANQPIIIENLKLGYKQTYVLDGFEKKSNRISYKGLSRYELIEPQNSKQKAQWEKNRIIAYQGSIRHFLKSLLNNRLKEEGFKAYFLNTESTKSPNSPLYFDCNPQEIIQPTSIPNLYSLTIHKPMVIVYENEQLSAQFSEIKPLSEIVISSEGNLLDPYSIEINGKMGEKRLANLLPLDFELFEDNKITFPQNLPRLPQQIQALIEIPREKIDIKGIQPYYLAGETIRLKTFVTESRLSQITKESVPSQLSIPLYVEFIDLKWKKILNRFTLKLEDGKADLSIPTSLELPSGKYQIRAYTNWMRNFSDKGFFKQDFTVFSQNFKREIPSVPSISVFDTLIVHIEGGFLVDSLKSKVAIETLNTLGEKISVPFSLLNSNNDTLTNAHTDNEGVTVFDLLPKGDEVYRIKVGKKYFTLPSSRPKGTILTIDHLSSKKQLSVFIQTNEISNDTITLLLTRENHVVYWKRFQNNNPTLLINIPKNILFGEINCFLIDKNGNQLSERIVDINPNEITKDDLNKDKIVLTKPLSHFFNVDPILKYSAEKGLNLKGQIVGLDGKENKKEYKLSMVLSNIQNDTTEQKITPFFTVAKKQFVFQNIDFYGKMRATFIAPENKVILDTLTATPPISTSKSTVNWSLLDKTESLAELENRKNRIILERIRKEKENTVLEEVVIRTKKSDPNEINGISPSVMVGENRIKNQPSMSTVLNTLIQPRKNRFGPGLKVYIENQELRQDEIDNIELEINPSIVEKILIFEEAIPYTYARATCAIVIKLRRGALKGNVKPNETFIVEGYHKNN